MFINYLLGIIGHAKTAFSLDEAVSRALDQDFVPNERYASLVVEEIPQRQRLQVGLAVFERCGYNNHERLKYFFRTLSEQISNDDSGKFFAAISESLRDGSDDENLRFVLQILHPPQWLELSEVARLRSENRLLKSFADGEVSTATGECTNGSLAMWSFDFWPHFILKKEFMKATIGLLNSKNPDALQYAVKFALLSLPSLADRPPWNLQLALASLIKSGSEEVYAIVKHGALWEDNTWSKKVTEALAEYSERLPSDEGDRPF